MRQGRRHCTVTVLAAVLLGACTTTTEIGGGAPVTGSGAPTVTGGGDLPMSAEACALSRDSLEVAAEAYLAIHGTYPETVQQMLEANLLMSAPDTAWTYAYAPGDRNYVITAVVGGPCD